jgi:hypothetical protein
MNLTSIKRAVIPGICLIFAVLPALQAQTPAFDQLKQKFEDGEIFNAVFSH